MVTIVTDTEQIVTAAYSFEVGQFGTFRCTGFTLTASLFRTYLNRCTGMTFSVEGKGSEVTIKREV